MRIMFRIIPVIVFTAIGTATFAQMSAEEVQRCVWSCLMNTGNDPASAEYDACVVQACNDTATGPDLAGPSWEFAALNPVDPPYLNGGVAFVMSADGEWRLRIACTDEGWNMAIDAPGGSNGGWEYSFVIDGQVAARQISTEYEGADILTSDPGLNRALMAGNGLDLVRNGANVARFTLTGSSNALGQTTASCP